MTHRHASPYHFYKNWLIKGVYLHNKVESEWLGDRSFNQWNVVWLVILEFRLLFFHLSEAGDHMATKRSKREFFKERAVL